jgi:hypothetical protein
VAAALTEICLCNVCSCQEILRRNGRGQARACRDQEQVALAHAEATAAHLQALRRRQRQSRSQSASLGLTIDSQSPRQVPVSPRRRRRSGPPAGQRGAPSTSAPSWLPPGSPQRSASALRHGSGSSSPAASEWEWDQAVARSREEAQRRSSNGSSSGSSSGGGGSPQLDLSAAGGSLGQPPLYEAQQQPSLSPTDWQKAVAQSRIEALQREKDRSYSYSSSSVANTPAAMGAFSGSPLSAINVASAASPPSLTQWDRQRGTSRSSVANNPARSPAHDSFTRVYNLVCGPLEHQHQRQPDVPLSAVLAGQPAQTAVDGDDDGGEQQEEEQQQQQQQQTQQAQEEQHEEEEAAAAEEEDIPRSQIWSSTGGKSAADVDALPVMELALALEAVGRSSLVCCVMAALV